jgi:hypothetical protein
MEIVVLLLKNGAKANTGKPLQYAKSEELSALLQQHGAVKSSPKPAHPMILFHDEPSVLNDILNEEIKTVAVGNALSGVPPHRSLRAHFSAQGSSVRC